MKSIYSIVILLVGLLSISLPSLAANPYKSVTQSAAESQQIKSQKKTAKEVNRSAVNINTASAEQLAAALSGIGLSKAKAIVAYRSAHGPFHSAADLAAVKGIGDRTVKRNKAMIRLK
jgi:competence protein ComEA